MKPKRDRRSRKLKERKKKRKSLSLQGSLISEVTSRLDGESCRPSLALYKDHLEHFGLTYFLIPPWQM